MPHVSVRSCSGSLATLTAALAFVAIAAGPAAGMGDHQAACSPGVVSATATPLYAHFEKAHFERSPTQQAADASATSDYVDMHGAWIESFTAPAAGGAGHIASESPTPFTAHMKHAHIERAPTDQVDDIVDTDQYVLTHTVLIESMAQPAADVVQGEPC